MKYQIIKSYLLKKKFLIAYMIFILGFFIPYKYDYKDSIKYLQSQSGQKSRCRCAWFVMRALQEGGCYPCFIYPAYAYKDILPRLGAKEIDESDIQAGDICVISQNSSSAFGHICVYDGKHWYSDFQQGIKYFPYKDKYKNESLIQFFHIEDGWHTANIWITPFEAIEYLICLIKNIDKIL